MMGSHNHADYYKKMYPAGTRLELESDMSGETGMPAGLQGTVVAVDDMAHIMMSWDNHRSLSIVPSEDSFKVLSRPMPVMENGCTMTAMTKDESERVYTDEANDKKFGCVGHLRFDHGSGKEFWHTWNDHRSELNTSGFKDALGDVVGQLKSEHLIDTQDSMRTLCQMHPEARIDDDAFGFKVDTPQYEFYLRCNAHKGGYNYCYCYDKQEQQLAYKPKMEMGGMSL